VVAAVTSGDQIVPPAVANRPDVAVLDIDLPGTAGLAAAAVLREREHRHPGFLTPQAVLIGVQARAIAIPRAQGRRVSGPHEVSTDPKHTFHAAILPGRRSGGLTPHHRRCRVRSLVNVLEHFLDSGQPLVYPHQFRVHDLAADAAAPHALPDDQAQPVGKGENDEDRYTKNDDVPEISGLRIT
jgi:CheY-like chemotaxis protein